MKNSEPLEDNPVAAHSRHYRPDIDGLRAIAVLLVVGYHAFPHLIPGGFIGVDIFFVISGFLITAILAEEMKEGTYSIVRFYVRRIKRIFPALIIVLAATFIAGWYVLSPDDFVSLGKNIAGGSIFGSNIVLLNQTGYFDIAAEKKPLLHLWSLGIEEQFYIVWPLILFFVFRTRLNLLSLTGIIAVASFIFNTHLLKKHPDAAFYLPFTRSWELLFGAILVTWIVTYQRLPSIMTLSKRLNASLRNIVWEPSTSPASSEQTFCNLRAVLGLVLIIGAVVGLHKGSPYPGWRAGLPVLGAMLVISAEGAWLNRKILANRTLVFIGLISYPLYLWHYPIFAYARILSEDPLSHSTRFIIIGASLILAWLTFQLVEKPLRFGWTGGGRCKVVLLCIGMSLLGLLGLYTVERHGFNFRIPKAIRSYVTSNHGEESSVHWRRGTCLMLPEQDASHFGAECEGDGTRPLVLIWGDSYAAAMYPGVDDLRKAMRFGVAEFTASACPPLIGFVHPERPYCKGINDFVAAKIEQLKPEIVVMQSTWMYNPTLLDLGMAETVPALRQMGVKRIVMVGPVPTWKGNTLPQNIVDYYFKDGAHNLLPKRTTYRLNGPELDAEMRHRAEAYGIEYISARDAMCNQDGCLARVGDSPSDVTAFDNGHLTYPGSLYLANAIKEKLLGNLAKRPKK